MYLTQLNKIKRLSRSECVILRELCKVSNNPCGVALCDLQQRFSRRVVNYSVRHNTGAIVCGYNTNFKRSIDLGKQIKQIKQINFNKSPEMLPALCERYGMKYIEKK